MSEEFVGRAQALQEAVAGYFRSYPEAEVLTRPHLPGALEVLLSGQLAARFEGVSAPLPGPTPRRQLRLLFDRDYAAVAPGYEFVAPGSPVLRTVLNDLSGRSLYTSSAVLLNLREDFSDLEALGVQVRHGRLRVDCRYRPRRYLLVRYLVRLASYEKTEDVVPVLIDGATGAALDETQAARLARATLGDRTQAPYLDGLETTFWSAATLEQWLGAADAAVQERVKASLRERCADLARQLAEELGRTERHFEVEFTGASAARRRGLEQLKAKQVQELRERYRVATEVTLLSAQEILAPLVEYRLLAPQGGRESEVPQVFVYDPLPERPEEALRTPGCPSCGQGLVWDYCTPGSHLLCGKCGTVETCREPGCEVAACPEHAVRCGSCAAALCERHQRRCHYCQGGRCYCRAHILESFEQQDICPACATPCGECGRNCPPARVAPCRVCGLKLCPEHAKPCPSCGQAHCQKHGARPKGRRKVFCLECLDFCAGCGDTARHLKGDLRRCADCGEGGRGLCAEHRARCVTCDKALCARHTLRTAYGAGCAACFAACTTCRSLEPRAQLRPCPHCGTQAPGRHCASHSCVACHRPACAAHALAAPEGRGCVGCFGACAAAGCGRVERRGALRTCFFCGDGSGARYCPAHTQACVLCGHAACPAHQVRLHDGRTACRHCAAPCAHCQEQFPLAQTTRCKECNGRLCQAHAARSGFRAEHYCPGHAAFVACGGCDRTGPAGQLTQCVWCQVLYCPHCMNQGLLAGCRYCHSLRPFPAYRLLEFHRWADALRKADLRAQGVSPLAWDEILAALTSAGSGFEVSWSENRTRVFIEGKRPVPGLGRLPAWLQPAYGGLIRLFHAVNQFRLVGNRLDGTLVKVEVQA